MSGPIAAAGAIANPTRYGALNMGGEQFTGLWTQRGPYRDAATAYLIKKFYQGSRFDSILDGLNREITARLTDGRRPGSAVYNNSTFDRVLSYYSFKCVQNGVETVRVMVDTATAVYDGTGGGKTLIMTKSAGAGRTRFLGVGTTLFMSNGVDLQKWTLSALTWQAGASFTQGQFVVDTNNNLQLATGAQTANIVAVQVEALSPSGRKVTVFLDPSTSLDLLNNTALTLAGMTTVPSLNGATPYTATVESSTIVVFTGLFFGVPVTAYSPETGTASTGSGVSGGSAPAWNSTIDLVTQDGGQQWVNLGSAIETWGMAAPAAAPTVTQTPAPSLYPAWQASTWYAPLFVILDSNGNLQKLTTAGTTGGVAPTWNPAVGGTTTDNTAVWTNLGASGWAASTVYALGTAVQATFSYWITVPVYTFIPPGFYNGVNYPYGHYQWVQTPKQVTVTALFECTQAGTSGLNTPTWTNGLGTTVNDNTAVWTNLGTAPAWPGAAQALSTAAQIVGVTNGYTFVPQKLGKSGTVEPTWVIAAGGLTTDGAESWLSRGPLTAGNTGAWTYAYSGRSSITKQISTASPVSAAILVADGNVAVVQGQGLADPQQDTIVLWRTAQGQSTLVFEDEFPNPGSGQTWIYTDTTPDTSATGGPELNAFIPAPVSDENDPPPAGMTGPVFHLQRIWAFVGNAVVYSGGPDTIAGNGNESFPPLNRVAYQAGVIKLVPITVDNGGILVFTTSGIFIILGTGTASNPFYSTQYCEKVNLAGYDTLDVLGTEIYLMEANAKVSSLSIRYPFDPQSGYSEAGFPIGDQFKKVTTGGFSAALFTPATSYLSWNIQSSGDTAMYVADGAGHWFRMSAASPPENGLIWSPIAAIAGGSSAVQSVETAPGVFNLLIGPATTGPILMRDTTGAVWTDNAATYSAWDVKGVNVLCSTGQWTEVAHIAAKSTAAGARPIVSVLLGEIAASTERPWNVLEITSPDPPDTPRSKSVYSDRYDLAQNGVADSGDCILTRFDYGAQAFGDELLDWSIFASTDDERKEMAEK